MKANRSVSTAILLALIAVPVDRTNADAQKWMRWELGNLGLSLELPGEPTYRRLPLSKPAQEIVQDHMAYQYKNDQMEIAVMYILLKGVTQTEVSKVATIIGGVAIASLAVNPNISDVRSSTEQSGNRIVLKASFKQNGIPKEIEGFILLKGRRLWSVVTARVQSDDLSRASAQRVLDSVKLE
ncbi:MAG TPA: hypothetical protein VKN18_11110 [Blastocatellia bacterium]|nr:hypothetical protein [Blastocatellia bacterium]